MSEKKDRILPKIIRAFLIAFIVFLICLIALIGVGIGVVTAMIDDQTIRSKSDFDKSLQGLFQTSSAYFATRDQDGNPIKIGELRYDNNNRELIKSLKDVHPYLIDAFISIEDRHYFEHRGIVLRSIMRAVYQQVVGSEVTTGGSTITQQLVKNLILNDRSKIYSRKAKEIVLALKMEQLYTKEQILIYYLNSVFFGKGAHGRKMHGVQSAARGIFNTSAKDLNLAQAAYLAGMVQRPNALNPLYEDSKNLERGLKRMKLVLQKMLEYGKITEDEYNQALQFDIKGSLAKPSDFKDGYQRYPFIMFAVEDEAAKALMQMDGIDLETIREQDNYRQLLENYKKKAVTGGYRFYTTIDKDLYDAINQEATKGLTFSTRTYKNIKTKEQLGATIIDNRTGALLAFVSGSEEFNINQQDHALHVPRQPGSTIKPLLVFAPAMEQKIISTYSKIIDEKLMKRDGSGYYRNANNKYQGPVTILESLKWSYNIPAIKTFNALGHQKGFEYLRKMNLPPHPDDGESAAIGGMTEGYTVEQMTAAFATFANQGKYNKPYFISKVTDSDGKLLWEYNQKPTQVFSPQTAYQMTSILKHVLYGTAAYIGQNIPTGYELAGKTGSTNDNRDLWFIGYTPEVTIGVWGGYDYQFSMSHNTSFVKKAWVNIFRAAIQSSPHLIPKHTQFTNPGHLYPEVCGFECTRVAEYYRKKKEEEERRRKEEEEKQRDLLPELPPVPENPIEQPLPEQPTEQPEQPNDPTTPTLPVQPGPIPYPLYLHDHFRIETRYLQSWK
jgi:penicillin-binding protein